MSQSNVIIGFGGNKGDTAAIFKEAKIALESSLGPCVKCSRIYESRPMVLEGVDPATLQAFLNAAAVFKTALAPHEILKECLAVEKIFGRDRTTEKRWQTRSLDLDILLYDSLIVNDVDLVIPHPEIAKRDFVLFPLKDINPDILIPGTGKSAAELIEQLATIYISGTHKENL